jgi:hypothetical protein
LNVPILNHFDVPHASFDVTPIEMALNFIGKIQAQTSGFISTQGPMGFHQGLTIIHGCHGPMDLRLFFFPIIFRHFQNLD